MTPYTILKESFRRETESIFWFGTFSEYHIFLATCCDNFEEGTVALYYIKGEFQKRNRTHSFWFGTFSEYHIFFWPPAVIISRRRPTPYTILEGEFQKKNRTHFFWFGRFLEYDVFFGHLLR